MKSFYFLLPLMSVLLTLGCLGNPKLDGQKAPQGERKRVVLIRLRDPENRLTRDETKALNSFMESLLSKNTAAQVLVIDGEDLPAEWENCLSLITDTNLLDLMNRYKADRIFYGDVFRSGHSENLLFLSSLQLSPEGPVSSRRQIRLKPRSAGGWEAIAYDQKPRERKNTVIMLDPGHGGVDTGAEARFRGKKIIEKELNNILSQRLGEELTRRGYRVIWTRHPEEDPFLNPDARTEIINRERPDFLISIHHDFSELRKDSGFAVYFSSFKPGLDTEDAYLLVGGEKRKYISQQKGRGSMVIFFEDEYGRAVNTKQIPWWVDYKPFVHDDTPSPEAVESLKLAYLVFCGLRKGGFIPPYHYTQGRIIEDRDYAVLRESRVPSILIETGFVTNDTDMAALTTEPYRRIFVLAVADSLDIYFEQDGRHSSRDENP